MTNNGATASSVSGLKIFPKRVMYPLCLHILISYSFLNPLQLGSHHYHLNQRALTKLSRGSHLAKDNKRFEDQHLTRLTTP